MPSPPTPATWTARALETSTVWQLLNTSRVYTAIASEIGWISSQLRRFDERQLAGHGSRFAAGLRDELRAIATFRPTVSALTVGERFYGVVGLVVAGICTYGMWGTKPPRHGFFSPTGKLCADQTQTCSDEPTGAAVPLRRVSLTQRAPSLTRHDAALTVPHRAPRGQFRYPGVWFTQPVHRVFYSDAGHLCTDQVVLHLDGHRASTCP